MEQKPETSSGEKRPMLDEMEPLLVNVSGISGCRNIRVSKNNFVIGRALTCDENIADVVISRIHCRLSEDVETGRWSVTNLSSTDTLVNNIRVPRDSSQVLSIGDILQLSLSANYKYVFTLDPKCLRKVKNPRMELGEEDFREVLARQRNFFEGQQTQRKDLEEQLSTQKNDQDNLKQELEKLLENQRNTESRNENLNEQITELQKRIEQGESAEVELKQKYQKLLDTLETEKLKFEEKLAEEKQKWQEILNASKQEKENMAMTMVEQMEEWRMQQREEWENQMKNLADEEKVVRDRLQNEKVLLEQKLQEMESTLKEKEANDLLMQAQLQEQLATVPALGVDLRNCYFVEVVDPTKSTPSTNVIDTIDLTQGEMPSLVAEQLALDKVTNIMDEQMTCSICSELFVRAMTLSCMHTFCRYCIECWIKRRKDCPECRSPAVTMTRSLVIDNFIDKMVENLSPHLKEKRKALVEERIALHRIQNPPKQKKRQRTHVNY